MTSASFMYYSTDPASTIQFAYPRIDLIDGTEPSIAELLANGPSVIKDLSPYSNHHLITGNPVIPYDKTKNGQLTFNGTAQTISKASALSGVSNRCTVVICYSTSDTYELWVRGSYNNSNYLAASYPGQGYYNANCGTPEYYVDTVRCYNPISEGYRNGLYHMFEAKNVDFSGWTSYEWFGYSGGFELVGSVAAILVYNRVLTADESKRNFAALRGRF
ncbi:MAG: hypothetical protein HGA35_00575 [Erysipelotrichaceae bacterium]|nr:hypothetical protein [Erysipelotrichaceae bacterium]